MSEEQVKMAEWSATMKPLEEVALGIRRRFFQNYRILMRQGSGKSQRLVTKGNKKAHHGDVKTDMLLIKRGDITDVSTFEDSVPNRPGARWGDCQESRTGWDGTGRLSVVRPGRPKGRTAVFGRDGWPCGVGHVSSGQGERTAGDGGGRPGMVSGGGGLPGTTGVMSYEVKRIRLEVYDLNLASTGGPGARTTVPYSPSGPHLPESSPSQRPQKEGL